MYGEYRLIRLQKTIGLMYQTGRHFLQGHMHTGNREAMHVLYMMMIRLPEWHYIMIILANYL